MKKRMLALVLAIVCVVSLASAAGREVKLDGYGHSTWDSEFPPYQLSVSNVVRSGEYVEITCGYNPMQQVYTCTSPAVVTCLDGDLFLLEAAKLTDPGDGVYVDTGAIIPDGKPENYYDLIWEGGVDLQNATFTFKEPGMYYVCARYDALGGACEAVIRVEDAPAIATSSKVLVDGKEIKFEAYNICGNNYFKLRDVAAAISGSAKNFDVTWDSQNSVIDLITGKAYTAVGGELKAGDGTNKLAKMCNATVCKNGEYIYPKAFLIGGNNYFKLRDLGELFDFDVSWDGENNCITVETNKSYTAD